MLQGITYPAIALGSEPGAMQAPSNNQTAEPVQNPNSTQRYDSNAIDSEANGAAQSSDSVYESTQLKKKIIQSSQQNRNDSQPDSSESNRNNGSASSNESTKTGHNLKTVGIRIRNTTTKMALWPSARSVHSKFSDKPRRRNLGPF